MMDIARIPEVVYITSIARNLFNPSPYDRGIVESLTGAGTDCQSHAILPNLITCSGARSAEHIPYGRLRRGLLFLVLIIVSTDRRR